MPASAFLFHDHEVRRTTGRDLDRVCQRPLGAGQGRALLDGVHRGKRNFRESSERRLPRGRPDNAIRGEAGRAHQCRFPHRQVFSLIPPVELFGIRGGGIQHERLDAHGSVLLDAGFLATGVSLGEACVLIGHDAANERLLASLERRGLSVRALMHERQLQVASVRPSADELLLELDDRIKDAVHRGMPAVRLLGNLNWGRGTPGWPSDREILRLEAQVTSAAERLPSIVVCAYDVTNLPGPMLMKGGFECHALTFRRNCLRHNEHHVPPERFLEEL